MGRIAVDLAGLKVVRVVSTLVLCLIVALCPGQRRVRHWLYTAIELIILLSCSDTEGRRGTLGLQKDGPASHAVPFLLGATSPRSVKVPSLPLPCPALFPNQPHGFYCLSCGCLRVCRAKNGFSGVQELGGSSMSICHFTPDQGYSFTSAKGL